MKTINSTRELGLKHHVEEGDLWVNPETGETKVWEDGNWIEVLVTGTDGENDEKDKEENSEPNSTESKSGNKPKKFFGGKK